MVELTNECTWCGRVTPPKRAGRPSERRFCRAPATCVRKFYNAAMQVGAAFLSRGPEPAAKLLETHLNNAENDPDGR